jgi:hypothetical protein
MINLVETRSAVGPDSDGPSVAWCGSRQGYVTAKVDHDAAAQRSADLLRCPIGSERLGRRTHVDVYFLRDGNGSLVGV